MRIAVAVLVAAVLAAAGAQGAAAQGGAPVARFVELTGTVDPATAGWVQRSVEEARDDGVDLLVFRLDTPGGLDSSMREMVRDIIGAPMPVVVYVAPDGARAASAGLFVTQAADVAAMAPQTNIGSATPITIGGGETDEVLGRKIRNDAAAYVRALAEGHGRNADLAERMVRDAVNVTAARAREERLIDVVAEDDAALLRALDGFRVRGPKAQTLRTEGMRLERRDMPITVQAQQLLVNPTVAYLLLLAGFLGIAIELFSPGLVGPGLFGAVALLLGLYGNAQLPVTPAGIALLLLGLAFLIAETQVASGLLGAAGAVALVAGGLLLYDTDSEAFAISVPAALAAGIVLGALVIFATSKAMAARRAPPRGDTATELVGRQASVRVALDPTGQVYLHGELWRARTRGDEPVPAGRRVVVEGVDGLMLDVRPIPDEEEPPS
jgi:membrane-bound serine protease (ClpP class)